VENGGKETALREEKVPIYQEKGKLTGLLGKKIGLKKKKNS